jgi:hypothetical protein
MISTTGSCLVCADKHLIDIINRQTIIAFKAGSLKP